MGSVTGYMFSSSSIFPAPSRCMAESLHLLGSCTGRGWTRRNWGMLMVMRWLDRLPLGILVVAALLLGLAPFYPEPHLWEKLKMLAAGSLTRPIDILDFVLHAIFPVLLLAKLLRMAVLRFAQGAEP